MEVELYNRQFEFVTCNERFTAMLGGIGSGKTLAGSVKSIVNAHPGTLGLVVAPSYRMLQDATIRTFTSVNEELIASYNKSNQNITLKNGAEVLFRSADSPDRLRGPNINWAWIDEGGLCQSGTWEIVIGRLRADGKAGPCWITSTPKGRNWLFEKKDRLRIFNASTIENPYLAREFVESLLESYSGEFLRQEVYGEFAKFEGLVYPEFDEKVHVKRREESEFLEWSLAIDEGYTNPAVILLVGYDSDMRKHVMGEFYERGRLQSDIVSEVLDTVRGRDIREVAVDSSAAGLIAELRNAGVKAVPRKGRVLDGIAKVKEHLKVRGDGVPRLTIDPGCVNMISEFNSYAWRPEKDEPIKENDHSMDAIRYLLSVGDGIAKTAKQVRW